MKLLFDQNIARKSLLNLDDVYPESRHVNEFPEISTDKELLDTSAENGFVLVTTEQEFIDHSVWMNSNCKVILIKGDNINSNKIEWSLRIHENTILQFLDQEDSPQFLVINS